MNGIEEITQERNEQITKHGRTVEWDVENNSEGQLATAATALLAPNLHEYAPDYLISLTPWLWSEEIWLYMCRKPYLERLKIAGAFAGAEIDRLDYIEQQKEKV